MAESSHEPSYYEIALTNRQVVVAFIILLVCLMSAFFSGVWIGREGNAARAAEDQIVRNTPPEPKEGQNLEELAFFDDRNPNPTAGDQTEAPKPPQPKTDTTLVQDLSAAPADEGFDAMAEEEPAGSRGRTQGRGPEPEQGGAPRPPPEGPGGGGGSRRGREGQVVFHQHGPAKPAPAKTAPAKTAPTKTADKAPAVPKGSVVIQVFSSPDKAQADRIRTQLAGGGYTAYLSPVEKAGHTMYRVRLGPFTSRGDADKVAEKVRKGYKLDTWVTE